MNFINLRDKYLGSIANSDWKQDLSEHLFLVGIVSAGIAKGLGLSVENQIGCFLSGLLHDSSKIMQFIQEHLHKQKKNDAYYKLRHHEISWLSYLMIKDSIKKIMPENRGVIADLVENAIFYHHPRAFYFDDKKIKKMIESSDDVFVKMEDIGIRRNFIDINISFMKDVLDSFCGVVGFEKNDIFFDSNIDNVIIPKLFYIRSLKDEVLSVTKKNSVAHIFRSCLVNADRLVSSMESSKISSLFHICVEKKMDDLFDYGKQIYEDNISLSKQSFSDFYSIVKDSYRENDRCKMQVKIAEDCSVENTSICAAPAAFGKNRIASTWIMKNIKKGERVLWVVPRNAIAISLGKELPNDIEQLVGKNNISIEVFLTGERVCDLGVNLTNVQPFCADIVITNIDSLLNPYINHGVATRIVDIHKSLIVFDEWHEFYTDEPMFYVFIQLMYGRNIICKAKTLMLSATPIPINHYWEDDENKTYITEKIHHFNKNKITPHFIRDIDEVPINRRACFVFNSIAETVKFSRKKRHVRYIIHGKYTKLSKKEKILDLIKNFGKESINKDTVSSCLIVQASLNVSFDVIVDSICSPIKTVQVVGRLDRFGNLVDCHIYFLDFDSSNSENSSIRTHFSSELYLKWVDVLKDFSSRGEFERDDLFDLYSKFIEDNRDLFLNWIEDKLFLSLKNTEYLPPLRASFKKDDDGSAIKLKKLPSGTLRQSMGSYYVTTYNNDTGRFLTGDELFTVNKIDAVRIARNMKSNDFRSSKYMKLFEDKSYFGIFSYPIKGKKNFLDKFTENELCLMARNPETPLVNMDYIYCDKYGYCQRSWLEIDS